MRCRGKTTFIIVVASLVLVIAGGLVASKLLFRDGGEKESHQVHLPARADCHRCNVILLTFDSLRADRLKAYGSERQLTPNIDRFASRAIVAEAISNSGLTGPSFASLFRSQLPFLEFIPEEPRDAPLIDRLNQKGYITISFVAHPWVANGYIPGFRESHDGKRRAQKVIGELLDNLRRLTKRPFFIWIHLFEPHRPYLPRRELFYEQYPQGREVKDFYDHENKLRRGTNASNFCDKLAEVASLLGQDNTKEERYSFENNCFTPLSEELLRQVNALYDAWVKQTDATIKPLLDYYERVLAHDTIFLLSSDHGETMGEHHTICHGDVFYNMLRIPFLLRVPGRRPQRLSSRVALIDVAPTLFDLLGIESGKGLRGRSIFDRRSDDLHYAFQRSSFTIIKGRYKYFRGKFYDVLADPAESTPLHGRGHIASIEDRIRELKSRWPRRAPRSKRRKILESLGYINPPDEKK